MSQFVVPQIKKIILRIPKVRGLAMILYRHKLQKWQIKMILDSRIRLRPSFLISKRKKKNERRKYDYNEDNAKRLFIYCIYESDASLLNYKLYFLQAIKSLATDVYIIINGDLALDDFLKLTDYGNVVQRKNRGYDIGAFQSVIKKLGRERISQYDQLILVNDTLIGPFADLKNIFSYFTKHKRDFWGLTHGEQQADFLKLNPYGYIPDHIQSFFVVFEKTMLNSADFYKYFNNLSKINNRNQAIHLHETVMTKHFSDLGYSYGVWVKENRDSAIYRHPLKLIKEFNFPLVKATALKYYDRRKCNLFDFSTEIPELLQYLTTETDYPNELIEEILARIKRKEKIGHILIIDGVEGNVPQCTNYRVVNKKEQLEQMGYQVKVINNSRLSLIDAYDASLVIIYRAPYSSILADLVNVLHSEGKKVLFDIDDLVIDTKYTDLLAYVQNLDQVAKKIWNDGVDRMQKTMLICDGVIASTTCLAHELKNYHNLVLLNRNLASQKLVKISQRVQKDYYKKERIIKIGYFSGSVSHLENINLILPALIKILSTYPQVRLVLSGNLEIPSELKKYQHRLTFFPFVEWNLLPKIISTVDINLAPLVDSVFNRAKSEIKWIEASLVKVPTIASNLGSFAETIVDEETGFLAQDNLEWFVKLSRLIESKNLRQELAENAYREVINQFTTEHHNDQLTKYIRENEGADEENKKDCDNFSDRCFE